MAPFCTNNTKKNMGENPRPAFNPNSLRYFNTFVNILIILNKNRTYSCSIYIYYAQQSANKKNIYIIWKSCLAMPPSKPTFRHPLPPTLTLFLVLFIFIIIFFFSFIYFFLRKKINILALVYGKKYFWPSSCWK